MNNSMFDKLTMLASWKTIGGIFAIWLLLTVVAFPYHANELYKITGSFVQTLDVSFYYDKEYVMKLFNDLKPEGRAEYYFVEAVTDVAYPIIYGILMILLITKLSQQLSFKKWWLLLILPVMTVLFDFLENATILSMLSSYPEISEATVSRSSLFSSVKWCFAFLSVGTIFYLGFRFLIHKRKFAQRP